MKAIESDERKRSLHEVSKYGHFSGAYFSVFNSNTGKYGPEKTWYLDTFHTMDGLNSNVIISKNGDKGLTEKVARLEIMNARSEQYS